MRHTEIGAIYLEMQDLSPTLARVARYHHHPAPAGTDLKLVSAVRIADLLASTTGLGSGGDLENEDNSAWIQADEWDVLFGANSESERIQAQNVLRSSVERLPLYLECLV
jgi:HD-like signal output (HDOD) protein